MSITRTAEQLVRFTREHAQMMDTTTYRDGFSDDGEQTLSLISILSFVNRAQRIFGLIGYNQSSTDTLTASGGFDNPTPAAAGRFIEVQFGSPPIMKPLAETTLQDLTARDTMWRQTPGSPAVYLTIGSSVWLYPVPPWNGRTLRIRHTVVLEDLVNRADIPQFLPYYHDALGMLAAMFLLASDAENQANQIRLSFLMNMWEFQYGDVEKLVRARSLLLPRSRIEGGRPGTDEQI